MGSAMTTNTHTDEQIERLGRLVEKANFLHAATLLGSRYVYVDELHDSMKAIKDEAAALYRELGGEEER